MATIRRLIAVGGIPCVGKTRFIRRAPEGLPPETPAELRGLFEQEPEGVMAIHADAFLEERAGREVPCVLLHFDLWRWESGALHLMDVAERIYFVTLVAEPAVVFRRWLHRYLCRKAARRLMPYRHRNLIRQGPSLFEDVPHRQAHVLSAESFARGPRRELYKAWQDVRRERVEKAAGHALFDASQGVRWVPPGAAPSPLLR